MCDSDQVKPEPAGAAGCPCPLSVACANRLGTGSTSPCPVADGSRLSPASSPAAGSTRAHRLDTAAPAQHHRTADGGAYRHPDVDSPCHFSNDGPAFQDIPLARLMGQGVVWRIDVPLYALIEPADLELVGSLRLEPGDRTWRFYTWRCRTAWARRTTTATLRFRSRLPSGWGQRRLKLLCWLICRRRTSRSTSARKASSGRCTAFCSPTACCIAEQVAQLAFTRGQSASSSCSVRSTSPIAMGPRRGCWRAPSRTERPLAPCGYGWGC